MRIIGLTGSIGMGKSTAAAMFRARGVPVHDADEVVHELYRGEAVAQIEAAFPGISADGMVDRARLAEHIAADPSALSRVEAIVHPLVRAKEEIFLREARAASHPLVLLDIPLLFETGRAEGMDVLVIVTADPEIQRERVLARRGMTREKFNSLLARQIPDAEKRRRAHFLIDSGHGMEAADRQVAAILRALAAG
jgi:dephospho-CoA kinase